MMRGPRVILALIIFLMYVNDVPDDVTSYIQLFEDAKIMKEIVN